MSSASRTSLQGILGCVARSVTDDSGHILPGASLVLALHSVQRGTVDDDLVRELSSYLRLSEDDVRVVVSFAQRLNESEQVVTLCRGASCSLHGARGFHDLLLGELRGVETAEVSCLGHCETGPNIQIGDQTYLSSTQTVVTEERGWRAPGS